MAVNKPTGDNARKGAVRKRSQLKTKLMGEDRYTKRSKESGQFMDQKEDGKKFKGVTKEKKAAPKTKTKATTKAKRKTKTKRAAKR